MAQVVTTGKIGNSLTKDASMTWPTTGLDLTAYQGSWTLDPAATSVAFATKAIWILPTKGTFKARSGTATVAADGSVQGTLVLDAASIDTHMKKRDEHLRAADFLDVKKYPTITFSVVAAKRLAADRLDIVGSLTVRGQTRPLTVTATVSIAGNSATLVIETDIDRRDWDVPLVKLGSGVLNHVVASARFTRD